MMNCDRQFMSIFMQLTHSFHEITIIMKSTKRVGIWIRVSTDMQVEAESPEHHERRARYFAESKDWQVVEVYRLHGVSGKSVMEHPETKRMLADIRSGHITGLIFSKLARLARSTKQLLEFAEIFRNEQADLISLSENFDTGSAAGRLFFTIISAMAEWEREEIASRVAASVPIRAKMGKSLGGQATFGYRWEGNTFVVDPAEAPVRKLIYELFVEHQRKKTVANELNARGYRTRNGSAFTATTIERLLRDSTAIGMRRANYTKSPGKDKNWQVKDETEWILQPCEPIISRELWDECVSILDTQAKRRKPIGRRAVFLLSGLVQCACGNTMYVYHNTQSYSCRKCKRRIAVSDIDDIYQLYLKDYLGSINHAEFIRQSDEQLQHAKELLTITQKERQRIAKRVSDLLELRLNGELSKERYLEQYQPLEQRLQQLDQELPSLEAEIDVRAMQLVSSDAVIHEAHTLMDEWLTLPFSQKRLIVETITTGLVIGDQDIEINLAYAPVLPQNPGNSSHHHRGSWKPPA